MFRDGSGPNESPREAVMPLPAGCSSISGSWISAGWQGRSGWETERAGRSRSDDSEALVAFPDLPPPPRYIIGCGVIRPALAVQRHGDIVQRQRVRSGHGGM